MIVLDCVLCGVKSADVFRSGMGDCCTACYQREAEGPGSCMLCDDDGNDENGDPCEVCNR